MVATAGWLEVVQGASNVIPAKVMFTLDIRHGDSDCLQSAVQQLTHEFKEISQERNLLIELEKVFEEQPVKCNHQLTHQLSESIKHRGYPVQSLFSGAGHDASVVSAIAPICMLFVRCKDGISHSPLEEVSLEDIAAAIDVCDSFFQDL
jgi:allantoate deiminase